MEFFEVIRRRRSVRQFTPEPVPREVIEKALEAALLAPNSSNLQTWEFFWVQSPSLKALLVAACLNQAAARTAQELVVGVASPQLWQKTNPEMIRFVEAVDAPRAVKAYYRELIPRIYGSRSYFLGFFKKLVLHARGRSTPTARRPVNERELQDVSIKSAALACENFLLAATAQGYATCAMEGFDEVRVSRLLKLVHPSRVVMVMAVGKPDPVRGTWGPQVRFQKDWFVHEL